MKNFAPMPAPTVELSLGIVAAVAALIGCVETAFVSGVVVWKTWYPRHCCRHPIQQPSQPAATFEPNPSTEMPAVVVATPIVQSPSPLTSGHFFYPRRTQSVVEAGGLHGECSASILEGARSSSLPRSERCGDFASPAVLRAASLPRPRTPSFP